MGHLRVARLQDIAAIRAIRLEMLSLHPEAFCADLDAAEAMTLEDFRANAARVAWFGGYVEDVLAGTVVFSRRGGKKLAHTGELASMYVRKDYRGTGLADALIEAVIDHAIGMVEQIELTVNAENVRAIGLYERHGFVAYGCKPRSIRIGDKTYDEVMMMRRLAPHR